MVRQQVKERHFDLGIDLRLSAAAVLAGQQTAVAVVNPYPPSGPAK